MTTDSDSTPGVGTDPTGTGIELLADPCPACKGQLVMIRGCACGCPPAIFCTRRGCHHTAIPEDR